MQFAFRVWFMTVFREAKQAFRADSLAVFRVTCILASIV